jgi:acetylglutamate kinase
MVTQDGLIRLGSRVFSAETGIPLDELYNGEFVLPRKDFE